MRLRTAISLLLVCAGAAWPQAVPLPSQSPAPSPSSTSAIPGTFGQIVSVAGYIYVSEIQAPAGTPEDIGAQTSAVLSELKRLLVSNGSSLAQLCHVQVTLKSASDFAAMNQAYAAAFAGGTGENQTPLIPPARTTFTSWLRGSTLISISAVAVPNGAYREAMLPQGWAKSPRPYSYIIKTDDLVFFSGLVSRRGSDDAVVKGSVSTQTQVILDNVGTLLETADLTYDDVVSAKVYITSPYVFQDVNDIYSGYFPKDAPARGTAVTELMSVDSDVEITMIASRSPKTIIGGQAASGLPVSLAVQSGPRVWLSAVIGDTDKHKGDVAAQTRDAADHFRTTLGLAGLTLADVVDTTVYLRDPYDQPKLDSAFRAIFPTRPPARALATVRFVVEPALVELMAMAVKK